MTILTKLRKSMLKLSKLDQTTIVDLLNLEKQGAQGYLFRQISRFFSIIPEQINQMEEALNRKDFEKIKHYAHKINGFSSTIGVKDLTKNCIEIEKLCEIEDLEKIKHLCKEINRNFQQNIQELKIVSEISKKSMRDG